MISKPTIVAIMILSIVIGLYGVDLNGTLTPSELTQEHVGKTVTVHGNLVPETIKLTESGTIITFAIADYAANVGVTYAQHQPVNLQDNMPVTVTGVMLPDHTIDAHRVLSECPSKYETETLK